MNILNSLPKFIMRTVEVNGIDIQLATVGEGPVVMLLHGWPFTWFLWRHVMAGLAASGYRAVAPDLRGIGGSAGPTTGYDLHTLADDHAGVLSAVGAEDAVVVAFDLGVASAWMLAMRHPSRVRKLVLMEALLGNLPGAEQFFANGAPWWFGFHGVPGLAETVLDGHEAEYLDWYFVNQTADKQGIDPEARKEFIKAYTGKRALRGGFEHYRAFPVNAGQMRAMAAERRLAMPTLALAGGMVGDTLYRQLLPLTDDLTGRTVPNCGHNIPEEQPEALLALLLPFLQG